MGVKQKSECPHGEVEGKSYQIDWQAQPRRPFKRGFVGYGTEASTAQAVKRRKTLGIDVIEDPAGEETTPLPLESFEEIGALPPWLLEALRDEECFEPTSLQAQALPIVLAGQNMVAITTVGGEQSRAYLIPAAVHVDDQLPLSDEEPGPVVMVLAPTQELAVTIAQTGSKLLKFSDRSTRHSKGLRAVCVSGGGTRSEKLKELTSQGAHIVVGTPKRLHDMAMKEQLSLLRVTMLILDGTDKMLDLGFEAQLRELSEWVRPERQTVLVSTTWPKALHELARDLCYAGGQPVRFSVASRPLGIDRASGKRGSSATDGNGGGSGDGSIKVTNDPSDSAKNNNPGVTTDADLDDADYEVSKDTPAQGDGQQEAEPTGEFPDGW